MALRVVAPDGTSWVVRRRWLPGRDTSSLWSRFRARFVRVVRRTGDGLDFADGCAGAAGDGIVAFIALVALLLLLFFVVIPLVIVLAEVVVLLALAGGILLARVLLRRPWVVEAVGPDGEGHRWDVVGWLASGATCEAIARHLEAGIVPPPGVAPS